MLVKTPNKPEINTEYRHIRAFLLVVELLLPT